MIEVTTKHEIPALLSKIDRLKLIVDEGWQDEVRVMMEKVRRTVAKLTPRSEGGGSISTSRSRRGAFTRRRMAHIATRWRTHVIGGGGKDRAPILVTIYNDVTTDRAGRIRRTAYLRSAAGQQRPYTLLHILEEGSRAHVIVPSAKFVKTRSSRGRVRFRETKGARFLHFVTYEGDEVFTKRVYHPGTRPYGMIKTARAKMVYWSARLLDRWRRKLGDVWG